MEKKKKVWLDCDPGHDDAMAIILAGHNESIELLGISTVCGNQTIEKTSRNTLAVLSWANMDHIDVVAGATKPLMRSVKVCPEIHGSTGLDTREGPSPPGKRDLTHLVQEAAVVHMYNVLKKCEPHSVSLVATACLTNVALLLSVFPQVVEKLEQIVILGGCFGIGNTGPVAEFNIQIDPEAAKIVFETPNVKIVQIPLEVTHTCLVTPDVIAQLEKLNSPFAKLMIRLLHFFADTYKTVFGFEYPPLHDPLAVAYVITPELFSTRFLRVDIETKSELSAGQTVVDVWCMGDRPKNVHIAEKVDVAAFWKLMVEAWTHADAVSFLNKEN